MTMPQTLNEHLPLPDRYTSQHWPLWTIIDVIETTVVDLLDYLTSLKLKLGEFEKREQFGRSDW